MVACGVAQEDAENGFASIIILKKGKNKTHLRKELFGRSPRS